jgi:hypothetical protein
MIEFNLLPDIKLEFIKAQRLKRLVVSISALASGVALVIFIFLLLFVDVVQKKHLSDLGNNITASTSKLDTNSNLNKILTVQKQINTLPLIEAQTPVSSRIFGYLTALTPAQASISNLSVDFTKNQIVLTGTADSLATVNQFVDTLKFTNYIANKGKATPAFSTVVLSSFGYDNDTTNGKPAQYVITFNFDPIIFNDADTVDLNIPKITTTRSITDQPTDLFQAAPSTNKGNQ